MGLIQAAVHKFIRKKRRMVQYDYEGTMKKLYVMNEMLKANHPEECINDECPKGLCTECIMERVLDTVRQGVVK